MKPCLVAEIQTSDGFIHQGMYVCPKKPGKRALLWIHGLTSNFYSASKRIEELVTLCDKSGMGFASFNNRGHDMLASAHRVDLSRASGYSYTTVGSGVENFEQSIYDIDAAISFLVSKGFTEVVLVGSSTGANKACYYCATQKNPSVKGLVLLSPLSDRLVAKISFLKLLYLKLLKACGLGEKLLTNRSYFPGTVNRFLSLISPKSVEDIFDYGDPEPRLERFSRILQPVLVIFGGEDTLADRDIAIIKKQFDSHQKSLNYKSIIIPNANHGFDGKEKILAKHIIEWINAL